ncbi:SDR family NAD(P)-dependent oxidoreductase [Rhodospirillum sp. A1_3_36]|uniref:SDR family NAD(P)-dependent oxidoreductase n=1 Tax=Rhodospirillum sp. A1_3_36 TaxID=3391666 RepID=UPI0039A51556
MTMRIQDDDLQQCADMLLVGGGVKECVILDRKNPAGQSDRIAYVVVDAPLDFDRLRPRLTERVGGRVAAFVPLLHIPLTADGQPDRAALERLPVWSDDAIPEWERAMAARPGIDRVAGLTGPREESRRHIPVDRLLRDLLPPATAARQTESTAASADAEETLPTAAPSLSEGGPLPQVADAPRTLPELLSRAPQDAQIIQVEADGSQRIGSYGALAVAAQRVLGGLRGLGLGPGDRVILQLDRNEDILEAFWGCVLGGIRPVIVSVPMAYDVESRPLDHLIHIWGLLDHPLMLASPARADAITRSSALVGARTAVIDDLRGGAPDDALYAATPDEIAFYTLSSGSTGAPKAVMLTHANVLARAQGVNLLCEHASDDVILNWLPFDHVGSISDWHIRCVALGCTLVYAPKEYVLGRPLNWMELIHRHRVTHSWAPNFAYSLVSGALKTDRPGDWDLSCVKGLLTAGEMITRAATREFLAGLAPFGLRPSVVRTAFGMAEMGSGVTYHRPADGRSLTFRHIDRTSLGGALRPADPDDDTAISFASLGPVIPGMAVRIVDDEQRLVPLGTVGHVQFRGAAVSRGYHGNTEANAVFREDGWFETGDGGFLQDGELFLTGRVGTGIIVNGANFYNSEIEGTVEQVNGVTASFSAACSVRAPGDDQPRLAVFFHTPLTTDALLRPLLRAIQTRLTKQLGIRADYLIPVEREDIPKTAIGKIQHKRLTARFDAGDFQESLDRADALAGNERTLPDRFLEEHWHRKALVHSARRPDGACLVALDDAGIGRRAVAALTASGLSCVTVASGEGLVQTGPTEWVLNPDRPEEFAELLERLERAGTRLDCALHIMACDIAADDLAHGARAARGLLVLAQALATQNSDTPARLLTLSCSAAAVLPGEAGKAAGSALAGVVEAVARTLPGLEVRHLDLPTTPDDADLAAVAQELLTPSADTHVALRDDARWVAGLRRVDLIARGAEEGWRNPLHRHGVYLLNNGLEGLGPVLAEHLLSHHHARVLILGHAPLAEGRAGDERAAAFRRLKAMDGACAYLAATPDDDSIINAALAEWGGALDGVIHLSAAPSSAKDSHSTLATAFEADMVGALALARLARSHDSAAFTLFSTADDLCGENPAAAALAAFHAALVARLEAEGVPIHGARIQDLADADPRRGLNALLIGLRLGRGRLLIGLEESDTRIRARRTDGPLEPTSRTAFYTASRLITPEEAGLPSPVDAYGTPTPCDFIQLREPETAALEQIELWPSVAEYYVYDDLIYYALANDHLRNEKYVAALERTVKGKIVVDVGTGKEAILSRLALQAGARKVYAIEKGDEAYELAVAHIESLGLSDRITVFHGLAGEVELPELADVCVSEIVGPIGGCEGAAVIINDAHRLLKPGGIMIPSRSVTKIAVATLPDEILRNPGFHRVPASYTEKIFAQIGRPFDLRVCIKKFPQDHLLSSADVYEDLDFSRPTQLEDRHDIALTVETAGRFDGFLVWLTLHTIEGEVIDILENEHSWLPVYLPVFEPGIEVTPGDRVEATVTRRICGNGLNPDFTVEGRLIRASGEAVAVHHTSFHYEAPFRAHPFYERLFAEDAFGRLPSCRPGTPLHYLREMPLTITGAIDREKLATVLSEQERGAAAGAVPASEMELRIAEVWTDLLGVTEVGLDDSFFELGGHSLLLVQAHHRLAELFGPRLALVDLFNFPTIRALVAALADDSPKANPSQRGSDRAKARGRALGGRTGDGPEAEGKGGRDIAVIGMACRFPGADDPDAFWRNLANGTESITFFSEEEVLASGIDPSVVRRPGYVKASPVLSDIKGFDAEFFGYGAQDATLMDPQQRLLLECGWEAMENAGYDPISYPGEIGVYAGGSINTYLLNNVMPNRGSLDLIDDLDVMTADSMGGFQLMVANDKDYLNTRLSYKLNLRGPSVNVQTACSTGLVVIHMACQSLLNGEADMFLAAGSAVQVPDCAGHLYQDGMIVSPDGHCRAFDAKAKGTIFGSGVGVVLLKRLDDAIRDGDHIHAVIKGSSVNNDGGVKVGFMAPSGEGEASAVAEALAMADVSAETIGFVEAHGTGTEMGDPIEVNALTQAFRLSTEATGFCAIGSVKTNIGHMQIASGMGGFIKTVLALGNKAIPASLHYETPNPAIDFPSSPFYVPTRLTPWPAPDGAPRRAGVNSLGIGGTNAHVILEEAPAVAPVVAEFERPRHILTLSARNETALAQLVGRYAAYLRDHPDAPAADVCFTANTGRKAFDHRLGVTGATAEELATALESALTGTDSARGQSTAVGNERVAFLFTGQGAQYAGMGRELYETQPVFRETLDRCADILAPLLDRPLTDMLYADDPDVDLDDTLYTQPALFAVDYALAQTWMSWGVVPDAVMGHSLGEYVAACVAGVFSLEEALALVVTRARLMRELPGDGEMLAVFADRTDVEPLLAAHVGRIDVAAENGPAHTVLSGTKEAIAAVRAALEGQGSACRTLRTSHAFHSPLMEPMLDAFAQAAGRVNFGAPVIPLISNVTGAFATDEVTKVDYWCRHIRQPVLFQTGIESLAASGVTTFLEVGPKATLLGLAAACLDSDMVRLLPSITENRPDWEPLLDSLAQLAVRGSVDWAGFDAGYPRRRLPLPTYPFQRQRYWLDRPVGDAKPKRRSAGTGAAPLLGRRVRVPTLGATVYETCFGASEPPLLGDHRVFGEVVVSGACHLSMMLAAVAKMRKGVVSTVHDVSFLQPLVIPGERETTVQVVLTPQGERTALRVVSFVSSPEADDDADPVATTHVEATAVTDAPPAAPTDGQSRSAVWDRCGQEIAAEDFYQAQADRDIGLGPSYRWIRALRLGDAEAVCTLAMPRSLGGVAARPLHPGLLDAAFGLLLAAAPLEAGDTWLPFAIEAVRVHADPNPDGAWAHLTLRETGSADRVAADVRLYDRDDRPVLEFIGFEGRRARGEDIRRLGATTPRNRLYAKDWRTLAPAVAPVEEEPVGRWLLLADANGVAEGLVKPLTADGARCVLAFAGGGFATLGPDRYQVDPTQPEDFARLLRDSLAPGERFAGVVHLWSLDETTPDANGGRSHACAGALHLVQALDKADALEAARLWLVTRGARVLPGDAEPPRVEQAPLWGLGLTLALEYPQTHAACVDLDPASPAPDTDLLATLRTPDDEGEVAWRRGERLVARLVEHKTPLADQPVAIRADGGYLITGGLGALGLLTAEWLVEQGARHLTLVGRRPPTPEALEVIARMEQAGATVRTDQADVADGEAMAALIANFGDSAPALRGVFHAAGGIADGMMIDQPWERFADILPAKTAGAWHLHRLTRDLDLDVFALFSSAASLLGNPGQANYAAANAFLDTLAHHRKALGLPATAINWGPWDRVGIADPAIRERLARQGFAAIRPDDGLDLLGRLLADEAAQISVLDADWRVYLGQLAKPASLFRELREAAKMAETPSQTDGGPLARLGDAAQEERLTILDALVRDTLRQVLGVTDATLDPHRPLTEQGLDSLMAVQVRNAIAGSLALSLPVSLVFNHPTVADIVSFLDATLAEHATEATSRGAKPHSYSDQIREDALDLLADIDGLLYEGAS